MGEVKEALAWVGTMLKTPQRERERWVDIILNGVVDNTPAKAKNEAKNLVKMIRDGTFELMGFAPNVQYIRVRGPSSFLGSWWVHPFSSPTLVAKHRTLPIIILVGPSLRLNEATIREIEDGSLYENDVIGFTG